MVSSVGRALAALVMVVVGVVLVAGSRERSYIHSRGQETDAVVKAIYGDDPERSQEVWMEYTDTQGVAHWISGRMAAPPHRNSKVRVKYHPARPEKALLASEPSHYDGVSTIFGLYFAGYGLFMGYRLWKTSRPS